MRRKFFDVVRAAPKRAPPGLSDDALRFIGLLYRIERRLADADRELRLPIRQRHTRRVLTWFQRWLQYHLRRLCPDRPLAKGFAHAPSNWTAFTVFADSGILAVGGVGMWRGGGRLGTPARPCAGSFRHPVAYSVADGPRRSRLGAAGSAPAATLHDRPARCRAAAAGRGPARQFHRPRHLLVGRQSRPDDEPSHGLGRLRPLPSRQRITKSSA
ncbi:MAG: transposase [Proteobacteria bacterium]|nr:transposase [Pseudomonadota bacterium]